MICKLCGTMITSQQEKLCTTCAEENEQAFQVIQNYLRLHRNASALDIMKGTGLDSKVITYFIREGRFM